jgi:hypothetical protein
MMMLYPWLHATCTVAPHYNTNTNANTDTAMMMALLFSSDNKHTGTTIKVSDGIRSERAFDLQKGDEGRRASRLTSRRETTHRTTVSVLMY